nr:putative 3,4-dihydroxy-2-butanone kinase isoform X1 [Ipomoea batatas]
MGGTSGIIYSILCKAAFAELKAKRQTRSCTVHWVAAREAGIAAVSKYGGASAGYRTLLDALILAASTLKERLNGGDNSIEAFIAFADAESTKDMQAQAGRSTYIPADILASVPDPGAMAATACIPPHARREDLSIRLRVSRLTLVNAVPAIPCLGIPAYVQPVVGVANVEKCISLIGPISPSTSFPQVILITAASFDEDLLYHIF